MPKVLFYKYSDLRDTETHVKNSFEKISFQKDFILDLPLENVFYQKFYSLIKILSVRPPFRLIGNITKKYFIQLKLYNELLKRRPDLVLAQFGASGNKILWSANKYGCPLVTYFRGSDATEDFEIKKNKATYKELFTNCDATICTSGYLREKIIELGANPDTCFVLPSGANTDLINNGQGKFRKRKRFITVGRFVNKKAHHILIMAFKKVLEKSPGSELVLIGCHDNKPENIEYMDYCKTLANKLGIDHAVNFMGYVNHKDVFKELGFADIYVQHSIIAENGNAEGTPVAIMEASASGLPVISTHHSGIPYVVRHGKTGYLVNENDVDQMAKYMSELLSNSELRAEMGKNGKKLINKHFSHNVIIPRLEHILKWVHSPNTVVKPALVPNWE